VPHLNVLIIGIERNVVPLSDAAGTL